MTVFAAFGIEAEQALQRRGPIGEQPIGQVEELPRPVVGKHDPQVAVEEGDAAGEVVDDGLQTRGPFAQQLVVFLELCCEPLALGDVLVREHAPAVRHQLLCNVDDAPVGKIMHLGFDLAVFGEEIVREPLGLSRRVAAAGDAILQDLAHIGAGPHLLGREAVHLRIERVANHEPLLAVEHGQALRHVVHGRIELRVLLLEPHL